MRVVIFCHSLVSDWNHGNAHFLRGVVRELLDRGCDVRVFEPQNGWSRTNLVHDQGTTALDEFHRAFPQLSSGTYDLPAFDESSALAGADLVIVHEWNDHELVARIGRHRAASGSYVLLFHDTHHRSVTEPSSMAAYDLRHYDGVLAFGDAVADTYLKNGWASRAWTWHEAADTKVFYPRGALRSRDKARAAGRTSDSARGKGHCAVSEHHGDVVWIGNWGDDERTAELDEFFIGPVARLGLDATVFGVRYPDSALQRLASAGITYGGWLPNHRVPDAFSRFKVTLHIPRRPYLDALPGIPTIRPFEALACGMPLVSARWRASGKLLTPGRDFLVALDGARMRAHLAALMLDADLRAQMAARGLSTIRARHTCAHRVDELFSIVDALRRPAARDHRMHLDTSHAEANA